MVLIYGRLESAAKRLLASKAQIAGIAYGCRFSDISNFNPRLKRKYGLLPAAISSLNRR